MTTSPNQSQNRMNPPTKKYRAHKILALRTRLAATCEQRKRLYSRPVEKREEALQGRPNSGQGETLPSGARKE